MKDIYLVSTYVNTTLFSLWIKNPFVKVSASKTALSKLMQVELALDLQNINAKDKLEITSENE